MTVLRNDKHGRKHELGVDGKSQSQKLMCIDEERIATCGSSPRNRGLGTRGYYFGRSAGDSCTTTSILPVELQSRVLELKEPSPSRSNVTPLVEFLKPLVLVCLTTTTAYASPITGRDETTTHTLYARDSHQRVWLPIIIVCAVIGSILSLYAIRKVSLLPQIAARFRSARRTTTSGEPREITAEQLAGISDRTANGTTANGNAATTRPRRARRARRTPSQMSTYSLPAYAKEPGEQELVVYQGPQELEDSLPQTVVINLDEEAEESSADGHLVTRARYGPIPESRSNTPLMEEEHDADNNPLHNAQTNGRESHDVADNSAEGTSLIRAISREAGPGTISSRGQAPAYFEVIPSTSDSTTPISPIQDGFIDAGPHNIRAPQTSQPPESPEPVQPRRSGFRSLLSRMSSVSGGQTHARNDSSTSTTSGSLSPLSRTTTHQRGLSNSSILSPFRTLSRQRSIITSSPLNTPIHNGPSSSRAGSRVNLTSPSLISLNSISAPLTHTAVRTEFTYPKTGPTPEQLKLISSRDSLVRFGVPYGPDAVKFAASMSRVDLAPPEFDDSMIAEGSGAAGVASGNGDEGEGEGEGGGESESVSTDVQVQQLVDSAGINEAQARSSSDDGISIETSSRPVSVGFAVTTIPEIETEEREEDVKEEEEDVKEKEEDVREKEDHVQVIKEFSEQQDGNTEEKVENAKEAEITIEERSEFVKMKENDNTEVIEEQTKEKNVEVDDAVLQKKTIVQAEDLQESVAQPEDTPLSNEIPEQAKIEDIANGISTVEPHIESTTAEEDVTATKASPPTLLPMPMSSESEPSTPSTYTLESGSEVPPSLPVSTSFPIPSSSLEPQSPKTVSVVSEPTTTPSPIVSATTETRPAPSSFPSELFSSSQRPSSRASQLSYASHTSYASDVTYATAIDSITSRRRNRMSVSGLESGLETETEDEYHDVDEDDNDYDEDDLERPNTPTMSTIRLPGQVEEQEPATPTSMYSHVRDDTVVGVELDYTPKMREKQNRHFSTATVKPVNND